MTQASFSFNESNDNQKEEFMMRMRKKEKMINNRINLLRQVEEKLFRDDHARDIIKKTPNTGLCDVLTDPHKVKIRMDRMKSELFERLNSQMEEKRESKM